MKWGKPKPVTYAERKRFGFLFLPKVIGHEWRWLEWAHWKQMYIGGLGWCSIEWIKP